MEKQLVKIACYLILEREDKILLLRRFNTGFADGMYTFISGHVDVEETFFQAMIREAKEEADIIVSGKALYVVHILHRPKKRYIDVYFKLNNYEGEIKNKEPNKCDDLSWFDKNKLPGNLLPHIRFVLENMNQGKFFSEFLE